MRILLVTWELPDLIAGGVPGHVRGLSRALSDAGHDVVIFTSGDGRSEGGGSVYRTRVDLPWLTQDDVVATTASGNNHLTSLLGSIGDWIPDVVHVHDWSTSWTGHAVADIFDVPLVATLHSTERSRHGGFVPVGRSSDIHAVESWLALRATEVICCSRFMTNEAVDAFELLPDRVHLVPNGIDIQQWMRPHQSPRSKTILAWGRIQYEKGFQVLAQAVAHLRSTMPVQCIIAGRGPYLPELQSQVDIEGVSDLVHLAGFVPDDRLRELLYSAGCVVIPSLYEPFGITALESLATGTPTIVARTGGLAEIMEGTSAGLLFEPGNSLELAERIASVLGDDELATSLRTSGSALLDARYSWDAIADSTFSVYERALLHHSLGEA